MADKKISQLPPQASPTTADKVPLVSGGITDYALLSDLITLFFNNIPSGAHSDVTRGGETIAGFVSSGGIWTADAAATNRNASMTAMICYINGRRISVSAVTARTFTASKDTYVDVLDNLDGTGTLVYTEVTNNATSPLLASNSIRIGTVVTGATTIAASTSIGQGGFANIAPVVSSQVLKGFDTLGNIVYPKGSSSSSKEIVPYKFSVYRTSALNSPNNTTAVIGFDTKTYDTGANVDVVTNKGRFTAPVAGYYSFSARAEVSTGGANTNVFITLYKNGAELHRGYQLTTTTLALTSVVAPPPVLLAAGDYIEVVMYSSSPLAISVGSAILNYFGGFLVSAS